MNIPKMKEARRSFDQALSLMNQENMQEPCLNCIRRCIEPYIGELLEANHAPDDIRKMDLIDKIKYLEEKEIIDSDLAGDLHRIRSAGNPGSHNEKGARIPTNEEVEQAFSNLDKVIPKLESCTSNFALSKSNNTDNSSQLGSCVFYLIMVIVLIVLVIMVIQGCTKFISNITFF